MYNLINTHTHTHEDQCEWHIMTRMTGPDCAVMCNLINTHTQCTQGSSRNCTCRESVSPLSRLVRGFRNKYHCSPLAWEDQREWHIMTRMTGPDCAVMSNLINAHTHTHTHTHTKTAWRGGHADARPGRHTHKNSMERRTRRC